MCFLVVKITLLTTFFTITIVARRKKFGHFDFVTLLLALNIIMILGLFAWELGTKYIWAFFVMNLFSNYINFMGFYMVLYQMRTPENKAIRDRCRWYLITGHVLYGLIIVAACTPWFGPFCRSSKLYPPVLSWSEIIQVLNVSYQYYLHCNGYFLKWEEHPEIKEIIGNEADFGYEPISVIKPMFQKQMSAMLCFRTNIAIVSLIIQVFSRFLVHNSDWLSCTNYGYQWLYRTLEGSFFMIFHMMTILM